MTRKQFLRKKRQRSGRREEAQWAVVRELKEIINKQRVSHRPVDTLQILRTVTSSPKLSRWYA